MIAFCPTCANLLIVEKIEGANAFKCRTCPYVKYIRGKLLKEAPLVNKQKEDVVRAEQAWASVPKTSDVTCPECHHHEARFRELQTRSADEPATLFYHCCECRHTWKEG